MSVTVEIPSLLRRHLGGRDTLAVEAGTVNGVLQALAEAHPALGDYLLDDDGRPSRFVNVYLGGEDVRYLGGADTDLTDGTTIIIVPAIAGG